MNESRRVAFFTIPYPETKRGMTAWNKRFSLNAYYSGKNYHQRKRDADDIHLLTIVALKRARVRKDLVKTPVQVIFYWDDGLDVDNHAVLGKMIVDALKGWILPDDNRRWYRKVSHEFWDRREIGVEVVEWEK